MQLLSCAPIRIYIYRNNNPFAIRGKNIIRV